MLFTTETMTTQLQIMNTHLHTALSSCGLNDLYEPHLVDLVLDYAVSFKPQMDLCMRYIRALGKLYGTEAMDIDPRIVLSVHVEQLGNRMMAAPTIGIQQAYFEAYVCTGNWYISESVEQRTKSQYSRPDLPYVSGRGGHLTWLSYRTPVAL